VAPRTLQLLTLQRPPRRVPPTNTAAPGAGAAAGSWAPRLCSVPAAPGMGPLPTAKPSRQPGLGHPSTSRANPFWSPCRDGLASAGPQGQAERGRSRPASERAAQLTCAQPRAQPELLTTSCMRHFKSRSRLQPLFKS